MNFPVTVRIHESEETLETCRISLDRRVGREPSVLDIRIPKPGAVQEGRRLAALCHELGHAVGIVIKLPGATNDLRFLNRNLTIASGYSPEVIESEKEAWRIAEDIFFKLKEEALKTYPPETHDSN